MAAIDWNQNLGRNSKNMSDVESVAERKTYKHVSWNPGDTLWIHGIRCYVSFLRVNQIPTIFKI